MVPVPVICVPLEILIVVIVEMLVVSNDAVPVVITIPPGAVKDAPATLDDIIPSGSIVIILEDVRECPARSNVAVYVA